MERRKTLGGLLFLAAALVVGPGCPPPETPPAAPVQPQPVSANAMMERALAQRPDLRSLFAEGSLRVIDRPNDFGLTVSVDVFAGREPDRMRLRATKASMEAFEVLLSGTQLAMYLPREKTLYSGDLARLAQQGQELVIEPTLILRNFLAPDQELGLLDWRIVNPRMHFELIDWAVHLQENSPQPRYAVYLDPDTYRIKAIEELGPQGQILFVKFYNRYQPVSKDGQKVYPFDLRLEWPLDERHVEAKFHNIRPDARFPETWDQLALPDDTAVRPLEEARIEDELDDGSAAPAPAPSDAAVPTAPTAPRTQDAVQPLPDIGRRPPADAGAGAIPGALLPASARGGSVDLR